MFEKKLCVVTSDDVPLWPEDEAVGPFRFLKIDETVVVLSDPDFSKTKSTAFVRVLSTRLGAGWVNSNFISLAEDALAGVTVWKRAQRAHEDKRSAERSKSDQ